MADEEVFDVSKLFGRDRASDYDGDIRRRIPGYEALHTTAFAMLSGRLASDARLLLVGAGTGHEMLLLAQARPDWRLLGVDPSVDMLAIAQQKFIAAGVSGRVEARPGTVADLPSTELFDAATALLVMHFLLDDQSKRDFLNSIARRLKTGALFLIADLTGQPGTPEFEVLFAAWQMHCRLMHGLDVDEEAMAKEFAMRRARPGWIDEPRHLELFAEAGFDAPLRFWSGLLFSAWAMTKR
jgi:tRNA (cmo5U34)-methyltransferase